MRVLVQFRSSPAVHAATLRGEAMPEFAATTAAPIPGLIIDPAYIPVQVPTPTADRAGRQPVPVLARGQLLDGPRPGHLPGQGDGARRPGQPAGGHGRGHRPARGGRGVLRPGDRDLPGLPGRPGGRQRPGRGRPAGGQGAGRRRHGRLPGVGGDRRHRRQPGPPRVQGPRPQVLQPAQLDPGRGGHQAGQAPGRPRHHVRLRRRHRRAQGDPARPRPAAVGDPRRDGHVGAAVGRRAGLLQAARVRPGDAGQPAGPGGQQQLGDVLPQPGTSRSATPGTTPTTRPTRST